LQNRRHTPKRSGFTFSKAVLKNLKGQYDYLPLDPYCNPRYLGKGNAPVDEPEHFLANDIEKALKITDGKAVYVSELGYAVNTNEPLGNKYHLDYAGKLSRAMLTARINPKVDFIQWFVIQGGAEAGKARYNMWWADNPAPVVPAFSAAAQIIENTKECKEINMGKAVKALIFRKSNGADAALWALDESGQVEFMNAPSDLKITDFVGGELSFSKQNLSSFPLFLRLKGKNAVKKMEEILLKARLIFPPVKIFLLTPYRTKAELILENCMPEIITAKLKTEEKSESSQLEKTISLQKDATIKNSIQLPPLNENELSCNLSFENKFDPISRKYDLNFKPIYKADGIKIDGKLDDWKEKNLSMIFSGRECLNPPDPHIAYNGDEDLSSKVYCAWNQKNFYFAALVKDDLHFNKNAAYKIWNGDCIQIGFDIKANAPLAMKGGYDDDDVEIGIAFTDTKGAEFYPFYPRSGKRNKLWAQSKTVVIRNKKTKTTSYEISISWDAFNFKPEPEKAFGMNYVIFDDDDGNGVSYWHQLSAGITGGKNPKAFKKFYLAE
jgi:hypothetical protein